MGKSTISTGPFSIAMLVYQRVYPINIPLNPIKPPFSYGFPKVPGNSPGLRTGRLRLQKPSILSRDLAGPASRNADATLGVLRYRLFTSNLTKWFFFGESDAAEPSLSIWVCLKIGYIPNEIAI